MRLRVIRGDDSDDSAHWRRLARVAIKEGSEEGGLDAPPVRGDCQVITVTAQSELESRW